MFNSKKVFALCATTLAGFSAVSSLAPMTALADVAKNGQTTVTYEGAPQPAEWGLSVPATVKLDHKSGYVSYGNAKIEIVDKNGTAFKDSTKEHTFDIAGSSANKNSGDQMILVDENTGVSLDEKLFAKFGNQGEEASETKVGINTALSDSSSESALKTTIVSKTDNSVAPHNWIQFQTYASCLQNGKNTISWTATEKNA